MELDEYWDAFKKASTFKKGYNHEFQFQYTLMLIVPGVKRINYNSSYF